MTAHLDFSEKIDALRANAYNPLALRVLEEYLEARRHVKVIDMAVLEAFADGRKTALKSLAAGLAKVSPGDPDLSIIYAAIHHSAGKVSRANRGGRPVYALPLSDVPADLIQKLEASIQNAATREGTLYALRQVLGAARRSGLPEEICERSIANYLSELSSRKITARTRVGYLERLITFCSTGHLPKVFIDQLKAEQRAARLENKAEPSARMQSYLKSPFSLSDVARKAAQTSVEAAAAVHEGKGRRTIHKLYITAGLLAFLSYLPERSSDIIKLVIGQSIRRDAFAWSLWMRSNKTGVDRCTDHLPDILTPYLDDLVLLGSNPGLRSETLMSLLEQRIRMQSPLFARTDLKQAYARHRAYILVKEKIGHGPHACRKAGTDELIFLGASQGDIMAHLGHRNPETAPRYYDGFGDKIRREAAGQSLIAARQDGPSKLVTAAGRRFDLEAINISLTRATAKPPP